MSAAWFDFDGIKELFPKPNPASAELRFSGLALLRFYYPTTGMSGFELYFKLLNPNKLYLIYLSLIFSSAIVSLNIQISINLSI